MSSAFSSIRQADRRHHLARMAGQIAQPAMWAAILIQAAWILATPGDRAGSYDLLVLVTFAVLGATRARIRGIVAIARVVLAVSFLGSVADRFGLFGSYGTAGVSWGSFTRFVDYTRDVNAFLPAGAAPTLAVLATGAEVGLGLALLVGFRARRAVVGAALLLAVFGLAMTLSLGVTSPLSYDVWVLATGAWMMAGSSMSCLTLDTVVARFRRRRVAPAGYTEVAGTPRAATRR